MFYDIYNISNIVFYCLFGLCFIMLLFKVVLHFTAILPSKTFPEAKTEHKFALLIPARNESKVIRQILDSLQNQTYNHDKFETFIIVETPDDPTCEIAKEYPKTNIIVRKHLELKGKGHALDEALKEILSKPHDYEAYFIFDADNVLDPNFLTEMNKTFDQGYEMAIGYRNSKNWNDNWISACSGLTFSMFSTFNNRPRSRLNFSVTISGTGYYVSANVIEKLGGWNFFTLAEDYEITLYSALNDIKSTYNENARFYDEQPTSFRQSWKQRIRWCKGFTQANKKYNAKLIKAGIKDKGKTRANKLFTVLSVPALAFTIAVIFTYQIYNLILLIIALILGESIWYLPLISVLGSGVALYIFLMFYTLAIILAERKNINLSFWRAVICVFANPFFLLLYVPIFLIASAKKDVQWSVIEHTAIMEIPKNENDKKSSSDNKN